MNRIDDAFTKLRESKKVAFIPYVTAGDPDDDSTVEVVKTLANAGASLVELGIPYSDPLADGPVIQDAFKRVLDRGYRIADTWKIARRVREDCDVPLLTMVSYSLVYRYGCERFVNDAADAGVDGAIVPDLTVEDGQAFLNFARRRDFKTVLLVAPTTTDLREGAIVKASTGFVYCISVVGITGARNELPPELTHHVDRLRKLTDKPVCVGFGVSRPEHVRTVADVADGVIVGSALVKRIARNASDRSAMLSDVASFVAELTAPLK